MFEGTANFDEILTNYAQFAYANPEGGVDLSGVFFPHVKVGAAQGKFDIWDEKPAFSAVDTKLARHNSPRYIDLNRTTATYDCAPHALGSTDWLPEMLQDRGSDLAEARFKTLLSAQFITRQVEAVQIVRDAVEAEEGLGKWLTDEGADIVGELDKLIEKVEAASWGSLPNKLVISKPVWQLIRNHPSVLDRAHGIKTAISREDFMGLLINDNLELIVSACRAHDKKSKEAFSVVGNDVFVLYNEGTPTTSDLSFAKEFSLTNGPEVLRGKKGLLEEEINIVWSSDRHICKPSSCARLTVS